MNQLIPYYLYYNVFDKFGELWVELMQLSGDFQCLFLNQADLKSNLKVAHIC